MGINLNKHLLIAVVAFMSLMMQSAVSAAQWPQGSEKLVERLQAEVPGLPVVDVYETPIPGYFAIDLAGGQTLYGSADAKFLFSGDMYSLNGGLQNLAENRRSTRRKALLDAEPIEGMVVFTPAGEVRDYVNVFTDVDCGYCRKLHQEMADINALGIEVRYLAYPRAGLGTPTHAKIASAWCAKDPQQAMTALKNGSNIPANQCDNPTAHHYELGKQIGVQGTPAIVTSDGRMLPGYMPAAQLAAAIGLE